MIIMHNNRIKEITCKMSTNIIALGGVFSLASFSQCEECRGWGLGAVGRRDEVGSGVGCGGTGGDVA